MMNIQKIVSNGSSQSNNQIIKKFFIAEYEPEIDDINDGLIFNTVQGKRFHLD